MDKALLEQVITIAQQAGEAILEVYQRSEGMDIQTKQDDSPVTAADLAAHAIMEPALAALLDGVPVLSEESKLPPFDVRGQWQSYWIIDPLDGTKEFIKRNGEFTVNIALVEDGIPVMGVVHVPVLNITYAGGRDLGAFKIADGTRTAISSRKLAQHIDSGKPVEVVASRSHGADAVDALMNRIQGALGPVDTKNMGSSLKLCLVAEGAADLYPRLALTSEWDTAAAQAVVEAAGGIVVDDKFQLMRYNTKEDILNPFFYVIGDPSYDWKPLLLG
ncbi:3'(2'),5'-bisphosphate nucleotidase CysQ [Biformimicrobium ophioploci]|uniref:3'(2'),5'-bisphosphate nucleotidase CysQ n=1 Tax=Biformimicrobium ophioploci TaxID=3036711 RepID=A0ABQ6M0B1_9GAMM|nr:3'(2'),5'-bisphosphate nucleotidase CysQ [Microbulbifer sp. NKW57]GMG87758.1 3'(2'),5'-bisphosphate nucleotidase CysQ [Microbulbifer sp. NKW57]